jgi:hypothetical protein
MSRAVLLAFFVADALLPAACGSVGGDGVVCMSCTTDSDCTPVGGGYFCGPTHQCVRACTSVGDCPSGLDCDANAHLCVCKGSQP